MAVRRSSPPPAWTDAFRRLEMNLKKDKTDMEMNFGRLHNELGLLREERKRDKRDMELRFGRFHNDLGRIWEQSSG